MAQKKIIGVIPSRYASSRFPGKPLADVGGTSLIKRVYEQAQKALSLSKIVVATDDERIFNHVKNFGGEVVMTSLLHRNGTERCAEVISKEDDFYALINIQGDEPFVSPSQIDAVAAAFDDPRAEIATLAKIISDSDHLDNPNVVKVITGMNQNAIYFSRYPVPYLRNHSGDRIMQHPYLKHIGIYGYRADVLQKICLLKETLLEKAEMLEQLRWIENGFTIKVFMTEEESLAIDHPEDLKKAVDFLQSR